MRPCLIYRNLPLRSMHDFMTRIFLLPDGRLRSGWRFILFIIFFLIAVIALSWLAASLFPLPTIPVQAGVLAISILGVSWVFVRLLDRRAFHTIGLQIDRRTGRELASGLLMGVLLQIAIGATEFSLGLVTFEKSVPVMGGAGVLITGTLVLVLSAANEEILFRGYPFQRLVEGVGGAGAILISSVIFGGVHLDNPSSTALSTLNTVLAGVLLAVAYLRTRALWLPIGLHFSWNWTMVLIGFPVSGLELMEPGWRAVPVAGMEWLHGGAYGPEGGVIATGAILAGTVYLWKMPQMVPEQSPGQSPEQ